MGAAECAPVSEFQSMADEAGLPRKGMYRISEVAKASGVSRTTLQREIEAGRLRTFLPPGRDRGRLVKPEWFDEWFEEGSDGS